MHKHWKLSVLLAWQTGMAERSSSKVTSQVDLVALTQPDSVAAHCHLLTSAVQSTGYMHRDLLGQR